MIFKLIKSGKTLPTDQELKQTMLNIGEHARAATRVLAIASPEQKNQALIEAAKSMRTHKPQILSANEKDLQTAQANGAAKSYIDRLMLNDTRIEAIAQSLEDIAKLPDPVGTVLSEWTRPNGLKIQRVRVPLGAIGVIFESRPNVTADAGALCLKAGNACILRTGSDSFESASALLACLQEGLKAAGLPHTAIQLVPTRDRAAVGHMLRGLEGNLDVIIPRGGKSLVARVQEEARVPVFAHLEGNCHVYIDANADLDQAKMIVLNAKMRRVSVCGAAETLLIDQKAAATHLKPLIELLLDSGCAVRGDAAVQAADPRVTAATEEDWRTEYLEAIIAARVVANLDAAIHHINIYGSHHTDAIVTQNAHNAQRFFNEVDSAIVLQNASTQFADGGEFGFGAEIGIATGRLHARGPVGVEQLTTFKYCVHGNGQIRP